MQQPHGHVNPRSLGGNPILDGGRSGKLGAHTDEGFHRVPYCHVGRLETPLPFSTQPQGPERSYQNTPESMHDYLKLAGELWEDSTGARHDNSPETTVLWRDQIIKGLPKPVQTALEDIVNLETQPFHDWKQTVTHWYTRHQRKMDQEDDEVKALTKRLLKAQVAEKDNETNKKKAKAVPQIRHFKIDSLSLLMPICNNHIFLPSSLDPVFSLWKEKGLVYFKQLFVDNIFVSFDILKTKFDLNSQLFRYFQIRGFARCNFPNFPHQPPDSLIDTILFSPVVISVVGKLILSALSSPLATRNTWEKELGLTFSDEWWQGALDRVNSTSSCARLTLIQFKVLHRSHLTKLDFANCWTQMLSLSPANHTHVFFSSPKLGSFWSSFYDTLSKAFNKPVVPSPSISIVGVPEEFSSFTNKESNVIYFASLVARRRILLQWKDQKPPSSQSWLKDLMCFLYLEKIKYIIRGCSDKFSKTWDAILSFLNSIPSLGD
ncbi:hypothetical protein F7725_028283 [Dissostichus mawsoni]|uniref:Reverse transcriptase n=1 Tax=Dissostichus mawsoni TaxID=36200 RepID=A0A7J5XF92_DISMA|nr:hypothetical protein F7725_028283 [Dissostichus mawsoni]